MPKFRTWLAALLAAIGSLCLAATAARAEPLFAQVVLNGVDTGEVLRFEQLGGVVMAAPPTLQKLGFRRELATPVPGDTPLALAAFPGVTYRFDPEKQLLEVTANPRVFETRQIAQARAPPPPAERSVRGAALNYGGYALAGGPGGVRAMVTGEGRVFGPEGVFSSSFLYRSGDGGPESGLRRLDTRFVHYDEVRARRLVVGDFITAGAAAREPVRAVGVSLATDFTLRPDVPVSVAPQIRGVATTRSSVEVLVDGVRRFGGATPTGPFEVDMASPGDGRGQVSLVVTDAQGRSTVRSFAFYADSDLLRRGTGALALEAGALREGYATDQDRYTDGFVSLAGRRGLSDALTMEAHATASGVVRTFGLGAVAKLGEAAILTAAATGSDGVAGTGGQFFLAAKRQTRTYSIYASHRETSANFSDLASRDSPFQLRAETLAGGSIQAGRWGALSAAYSDLRGRDRRYQVANLGWSGAAGPVSLFASGIAALSGRRSYGLTIGLSAPLGRPGRSISAQAASDGSAVRAGVQVAQSADGPGTWGWRASVDGASGRAGGQRLEGEVRRVTTAGEVGLGVSQQDGRTFAQAYGSGAVVWLGGRLYAANQLGDSFAVVETGAPNVEVSVENRVVGRTGADGRLLALRLSPDATNRLAIQPESVALTDEIVTQASAVRPPRGGAVIVRLPVRQVRAALVRLVDPSGAALPAGLRVTLNGEPSGVTGFEGLAYLTGLAPDANRLTVESDTGRCRLEIPHVPSSPNSEPPRPLVCDLADPGPVPSSRRVADRGPGVAELFGSDTAGRLRDLSTHRIPPD